MNKYFQSVLKVLMALTLIISGINIKVMANNAEIQGVQIQYLAYGESLNNQFTNSGSTIWYDVIISGTYVVDDNAYVLSTDIYAKVSQTPTESFLQAYVKGCKTTISGKRAITTVTIGYKYDGVITTTTTTFKFENSVAA